MFQIGEFSRIARVTTAQLRHYDKMGLFQPQHTDTATGYRYYSAQQLPHLNRILALKDLGLSLDQIRRLLESDVSAEELHGMLALKKAQVEQTLRDELTRMRSIEERLWEIETEGVLRDDDVVLKTIPEQQYLSTRRTVPTIAAGFNLMYEIQRLLPAHASSGLIGNFGLIFHSEGFATEEIDVEMGFLLQQDYFDTLPLPDGDRLTVRKVPVVDKMATLVRVGIFNNSVGHYGALGTWIERHDLQLSGPGWEVFIEPFVPGKEDETVIEIRLPVKHREPKEEHFE